MTAAGDRCYEMRQFLGQEITAETAPDVPLQDRQADAPDSSQNNCTVPLPPRKRKKLVKYRYICALPAFLLYNVGVPIKRRMYVVAGSSFPSPHIDEKISAMQDYGDRFLPFFQGLL